MIFSTINTGHRDGWDFNDPDTWTDDDYDLSELSPEDWPAWAQDEYLDDEEYDDRRHESRRDAG